MSTYSFTWEAGKPCGVNSECQNDPFEEGTCLLIGASALGESTKWVRLPKGIGHGLDNVKSFVKKHMIVNCPLSGCNKKHEAVSTYHEIKGKEVCVLECTTVNQFIVYLK